MLNQKRPFHLMSKPTGPDCNLDCTYCFYLEKKAIFQEQKIHRMSDEVLDAYVKQYCESQNTPEILFAWQGGEPTLMGVEFFKKAVALQKKYSTGRPVQNAFQTNGILIDIFEEWVRRDVGNVFVQIFDVMLNAWMGMPPPLCIFSEKCGNAMIIEYNGDLYSCDHFVYPDYHLGNILKTPMSKLVQQEKQMRFGDDKLEQLPKQCLNCDVRFACNGECPKHRFMHTADAEPGLSRLCESYKMFLHHIDPYMKTMAQLLREKHPCADIRAMIPSK